MARSASYHPIKDITTSNAKLLEEVDPDLVVFDVDHTKSFVPLAGDPAKTAALVREQMLKKKLSMTFGQDLLERSGWGSGIRLPFANKDNQELEKLLEIKQRKYLAVQSEVIDNQEHIKSLEENFNRTSEDISTSHNYLANRKKQIEHERDLLSLAERVHSKILQDKVVTEKEKKHCRERCERMQENQVRRMKNLCELRDLIEFDREALKEYHDRLMRYENDKMHLGRIIDEDAKIIESIEKQYVELGANRKVLKRELDMQAMTTAKSQEQLDRLSVEFRKVYRHRQEMLGLWASNIENAKRKDVQMNEVADEYFNTKEKMRELESELMFREKQYKQVQCSIRNTRFQLSELDKKVTDARFIHHEETVMYKTLRDGLNELQRDIRASSVEERRMRQKYNEMENELAGLDGRLSKARSTVELLRAKLNEVNTMRSSVDKYINELEKILGDEFKRTDVVFREIEQVRKCFWERSNDKKTILHNMAHLDQVILGLKSNLSNLEAKEFLNMEFLAKQSAKVYRLDLDCSTLEHKISHAENESINPQYFVIQTEIGELRNQCKQIKDEKNYIAKQLGYLDHLISKNGSELTKNRDEKDKLNRELLEINMVSQRTQKLMSESDKQLQDLQVENSLETVNHKRLMDGVKRANDELFSLSEHRRTICCAVSERKAEIETKRLLNTSKLKALIDCRDKLKVHIKEMQSSTEKWRGRFDLITKMMTESNSDVSEEESVAVKVRRAARLRESLSLEARKWEKRIEEAKQELQGLENVHKLVHASNLAVKEKLTPIEEGSAEDQELTLLDHEEKAIHVRKRRALRFKTVLLDKVEELTLRMSVMEQETQATGQLMKMKTAVVSKNENELIKQKEKVQRWNNLCLKVLKEIKPSIKKEDYTVLQQDLKIKLLQEKYECAFNKLIQLLTQFPEFTEFVVDYFGDSPALQPALRRLLKATLAKQHAGLRPMTNRMSYSREESAHQSHRQSQSQGPRPSDARAGDDDDDENKNPENNSKSTSAGSNETGRVEFQLK